MDQLITWVIPVAGIAAIAFALYLAWDVLRSDTGTPARVGGVFPAASSAPSSTRTV